MRKFIFNFALCLLPWLASAQPILQRATPTQVRNGTDNSRYVTPYAIASAGISSNGITAAGGTNIVNGMRTQSSFNIGGNAATATTATNATLATNALNWAYSNSVSPLQYGAVADASSATLAGTDDAPAFAAALAAKPGNRAWWVVDGGGKTYNFNTQFKCFTNQTILRNMTIVVSNYNLTPLYFASDQSLIENVTIIGPGNGVSNSSCGIIWSNKPWMGEFDYLVHSGMNRMAVWGFSTNVWVHGMEHGEINDVNFVGAKNVNLYLGYTDMTVLRRAHLTTTPRISPSDWAPVYFPTNINDAWSTNAIMLFIDRANSLSLQSVSPGEARHAIWAQDVLGLHIDNMHIENMRNTNLNAYAAVNVFSNITGLSIEGGMTINPGNDNLHGFLLLDCPSPTVSIDCYGQYGTLPFIASYWNPTAVGGSYHPGVSAVQARRAPRISRGGITHRTITNLTYHYSTNGVDMVLPYVGTVPNTDNENVWNQDNTFGGRTFITNQLFYRSSRTSGDDIILGASYGTVLPSGNNFSFDMVGLSDGGNYCGLLSYQDYQPLGWSKLNIGGNSAGRFSLTEIAFSTANSYNSGNTKRWLIDTTGDLLPQSTAYDIGTTSARLGSLNATNINQSLDTPANASATGTQGMIKWDANYIYICTANNTWKRVAIATWP